MGKTTAKQTMKIKMIQGYLKTEVGLQGMMLKDNDVTSIFNIKSIYQNAAGVFISGATPFGTNVKREFLDKRDITKIFNAGKNGDEDFKIFIETHNTEETK